MGALSAIRVLEFAGIGPGPFCGMLLADMGAEVLRLDRPAEPGRAAESAEPADPLARGRRSAGIDLKHAHSPALVLELVERADVLIEGYRPGVMERLGLGPEICLARNPRLVYGRMTGWGQTGPLRGAAGHDINYIALAGALHPLGRRGEAPLPPLNLLGDFGGGGMLLAVGILSALVERHGSGLGQVVDAAMVDGAALLMAFFYGLRAAGGWSDERGSHVLAGASPFYQVYETRDGEHVAIGALEPQFYTELLQRLGLEPDALPARRDRARWPELQARLAEIFRSRTRAEWCALLEGSDACFAPVLSMAEAAAHPHSRERHSFTELEGVLQPAPAPRLGRTPGAISRPPPRRGEHTDAALADWGIGAERLAQLRREGAIG